MTTIRATLMLPAAALMIFTLSSPAQAKQARLPRDSRGARLRVPVSSARTIIAGGAATCRLRASTVAQRRTCLACVARGGVFPLRRDGRGRCRDLYPVRISRQPQVGPTVMRSARQCLAQVQGDKKQRRCVSCVRWGGLFDRREGGSCRLPRQESIGVRHHYHTISR